MVLNQILKSKELIGLFNNSYEVYIKSNTSLKKSYSEYSFSKELKYKWEDEGFLESFKNNFFSLLMTSIIIDGSEDEENTESYVKILSCLRQVITSTDNIVDREEKGIVFLNSINNYVVKNTLINIATQDIMGSIVSDLNSDLNINREIINKVYSIAHAESLRDEEEYEGYPRSDYIKNVIHRGIGGELLELALVVPKYLEKNKKIAEYSRGLFKIGMALQGLDDLCDVEEDLEEKKINLAVARLMEEKKLEKDQLNFTMTSFLEINEDIMSFIKSYLNETISEAVEGFIILKENGYPITDLDIKLLLKHLFKVRGLEQFWKLIELD